MALVGHGGFFFKKKYFSLTGCFFYKKVENREKKIKLKYLIEYRMDQKLNK